MLAPTLSASKWDKKRMGWVIPRNIYKVEWISGGFGVVEKYVVADTSAMAKAKTTKKWGKLIPRGFGLFVKLLYRKGIKYPPYAPPKVHLK